MSEMEHSSNNKRIAKNTIFLYFRMLFLMFLSLFTSRLTLDKLGVENFGIYNVVGGVIVLFQFFNNCLSGATQRYLNYSIGEGDVEKTKRVFSISFKCYLILSLLIFFLCETVGMFLVRNYLSIPAGREKAAEMVLHISSITMIVNMMKIPFNASIIAEEKMSFYAYISILDGILKLAICFLLSISIFDKLILFSNLILGISLLQLLICAFYCKIKFSFITFKKYKDKELVKGILSFSSWNIVGTAAGLFANQGMSVIFNHFNGVLINAALGVANQVNNAVSGFLYNFQTAFNPQIVKSFAQNDKKYLFDFVYKTAKYSFFLLYFVAQPLFINLDFVLHLWLKEVPEMSNQFVIVLIVFTLIDALGGPFWMLNEAEGNIKFYQIIGGISGLLVIPVAYWLLVIGVNPYVAMTVRIVQNILFSIWRVFNLKKRVNLPLRPYFLSLIPRIICCSGVSFTISYLAWKITSGVSQFFVSCVVSCITLILMYWLVGLTKIERDSFSKVLKNKIHK